MSSVFKSMSDRREIARRERRMWRTINQFPLSMRDELIEMRDCQVSNAHR